MRTKSRSCRSCLLGGRRAMLLKIKKMPFMPSMPSMFRVCAGAFLFINNFQTNFI